MVPNIMKQKVRNMTKSGTNTYKIWGLQCCDTATVICSKISKVFARTFCKESKRKSDTS